MIPICELGAIPSGEAVRVDGPTPVAVFNADGELYAIDDTCTHQDASLADGWLEGCVVECPLHASCFDLRTGQVGGPPAKRPVRTHRVVVLDGMVYVQPCQAADKVGCCGWSTGPTRSASRPLRPQPRAVAEADFIFATTLAPANLLRHAPGHADIIVDIDDPSFHSVMPFYDLASRGNFRVTRIFSGGISADQVLEQVNRCRELCLEFEIVRCG